MGTQVLSMGMSAYSWVLWKLTKNWISGSTKRAGRLLRLSLTSPGGISMAVWEAPPHQPLSTQQQDMMSLYSVVCLSLSCCSQFLLLFVSSFFFPHCWFSSLFPVPILRESLTGCLIIIISVFADLFVWDHITDARPVWGLVVFVTERVTQHEHCWSHWIYCLGLLPSVGLFFSKGLGVSHSDCHKHSFQ